MGLSHVELAGLEIHIFVVALMADIEDPESSLAGVRFGGGFLSVVLGSGSRGTFRKLSPAGGLR
jgi:hypothetical protein